MTEGKVSKKISWEIIGAGVRAKRFAETLKRNGASLCIAVVVLNEQYSASLAKIFDVPSVYDDYPSLLHDARLGAVCIGTPLAACKQIVFEALTAKRWCSRNRLWHYLPQIFCRFKKTEEYDAFLWKQLT